MGGGGSDLFSKVYIGQRGEGIKYWQNFADVLYGWPLNSFCDFCRVLLPSPLIRITVGLPVMV